MTLTIDGTPQSYVDVDDPRRLEFEYVRRLADLCDAIAPPGAALRVLHLGGGGLTLPRYVAATRPRSAQRVVERDPDLIALVRRELPLPRGADLRVRAGDGRDVLAGTAAGRYDLVVTDVFAGGRVPAAFTSVEFARSVRRVLRVPGWYAVNLADDRPLGFSRGQVATLRTVFPDVCLLAEPGVLRGRRYGNVVLAAATHRGGLPVAELAAHAGRDMFPARLVHGDDLDRFVAGAAPVADATAVPSPPPPPDLFG